MPPLTQCQGGFNRALTSTSQPPDFAVSGGTVTFTVSGLGVLLAALLPADLEPRSAAVMAVGFAFAAMGTMTSTVLPAVNPSLRAEMPALGDPDSPTAVGPLAPARFAALVDEGDTVYKLESGMIGEPLHAVADDVGVGVVRPLRSHQLVRDHAPLAQIAMQIVPVESIADQIVIADLQVFHDLSSMN